MDRCGWRFFGEQCIICAAQAVADKLTVGDDRSGARSAVENDVYSLLRDRPDLADAAAQDPVGFVRSHFDIDMDGFDVDLRREGPGSAIIVLQNIEEREQLSDDMLDLVSAGGAPTTATTTASTNRDS